MTPTVDSALVAEPAGQVSGSVLSPLDTSASCSSPSSRRASFSDASSCSGTRSAEHWVDVFRTFYGSDAQRVRRARPGATSGVRTRSARARQQNNTSETGALRVPSEYLEVIASKAGSTHRRAGPRDGEHRMTRSTTTPLLHRVLRTRATGGVRRESPVVKRSDNTTDKRSIGGRLLSTGER
jgi:hypothetical protein